MQRLAPTENQALLDVETEMDDDDCETLGGCLTSTLSAVVGAGLSAGITQNIINAVYGCVGGFTGGVCLSISGIALTRYLKTHGFFGEQHAMPTTHHDLTLENVLDEKPTAKQFQK